MGLLPDDMNNTVLHYPSVLFFLLLVVCPGQAADPVFRVEPIDVENECGAVAVLDIDRDGITDILCGNHWYAGPNWKRHRARQVEVIRGRLDDYSNLLLDVDGDGLLDVISCNYRSQSIYWLRQPPRGGGVWERTVAAKPGSMETGRLADIDGDGRLDVLPNGTKFAAWWSIDPSPDGPIWNRHDLPAEAVGHGIGFGDIDGDGRGDIVSPRGWFRSGTNARSDRWQPMLEFQLHRDAGLPILVHDVDDDGDADIVWGRGHQCGLYWLEQKNGGKKRSWQQHTIDSELTQVHSLLLADFDGDGKRDIIAGRRYLGHDGKDIGEHDPMRIDGYHFQQESRSFRRFPISRHPRAATGLDPKAIDIDSDGDQDLVVADRSGLYLIRNRLGENVKLLTRPNSIGPPPSPGKLLAPSSGTEVATTINNGFDWGLRRQAILKQMETVMGPLPGPQKRVPLDVKTSETHDEPGFTRMKLTFQAEPGDRVPAYLFVPKGRQGKRPAMLCLHQTTGIGKGEPAGLGGRNELHYALELVRRGYVCVVPDYPSFGDYTKYDFENDDYVSGTMKAIWNNHRAVDFLESLPQVDADRIGCIGHSLGGHNALFTAAFDQRLKMVVTSCGFTAFHHYYDGRLAGWTSPRYMPRIRDVYDNDPDKMPFDFYGVLAAIAPRGIFINAPLKDGNFDVNGVRKVVGAVEQVVPLLPSGPGIQVRYPDAGHGFPDPVRVESYRWLDNVLRP